MRIKTVFYFILFVLCLIGFFYLQSYDKVVEISLANYIISTKLIFLSLLLIIAFLLFNLLVKIIFFPFELVGRLIVGLKNRREKRPIEYFLQASQYSTIGSTDKAYSISRNILDSYKDLPNDVEESFRLLFAKFDVGFNVKLHYMQKLLNSSAKLKFFAAKELSASALAERAYHYSLEFGQIAMNINSSEPELVILLIKIYAAIEDWDNLGEMLTTLKRIDNTRFADMREKIANYYLKAGKHFIGLGETDSSVFYLKKCLEYDPNCVKCIELIANIYPNNKDFDLKSLLENAFASNPSFEIFKIYYQHFKNTLLAQKIYSNLVSLIDGKKHTALVIAIAYFLNMEEELDKIVLPLV